MHGNGNTLFGSVVVVKIDPPAAGVGVGPVITLRRGQGPVAIDVLLDLGFVLLAIGQVLFRAEARTVLAAGKRDNVIAHGLVGANDHGAFHLGLAGNGGAPAEDNKKRHNGDNVHGRLPSEPPAIVPSAGLRTG